MRPRIYRALGALILSLGLSGCSLCDGWFGHKNKACGDSTLTR